MAIDILELSRPTSDTHHCLKNCHQMSPASLNRFYTQASGLIAKICYACLFTEVLLQLTSVYKHYMDVHEWSLVVSHLMTGGGGGNSLGTDANCS